MKDLQKLVKFLKNEKARMTLSAYLDSDMNVTRAAREMYVHRNTIVYWLNRVREETGYDMMLFVDCMDVYRLLHTSVMSVQDVLSLLDEHSFVEIMCNGVSEGVYELPEIYQKQSEYLYCLVANGGLSVMSGKAEDVVAMNADGRSSNWWNGSSFISFFVIELNVDKQKR